MGSKPHRPNRRRLGIVLTGAVILGLSAAWIQSESARAECLHNIHVSLMPMEGESSRQLMARETAYARQSCDGF